MKKKTYALGKLPPDTDSAPLQERIAMGEQVHYENEGYAETDDDDGDESRISGTISRATMPLLFSAIHTGKIEEVERFLDQSPKFINVSGYGGLTPLHAACHMQQLEILRLLITRGAQINSHDSLGNTALHVAVREIWHDGARELLHQGASPNEMSNPPNSLSNMIKETPLHTAVRMGDKVSTTLILEHQPDLNMRDGNNQTVFHVAASKKNVLILRALMADANLSTYMNNMDKDGHSIYHAALSNISGIHGERPILKVIQCIYRFHNNLDQANVFGETPLIRACHVGLPEVVKFFIDNGANPAQVTHEKQSAVHAACISGNSKALQHLINTNRITHLVSSVDNHGNHPFYYATENSSLECCKLLLQNGESLASMQKEKLSNCTLVIKYLPTAMQLFRELFNSGIKLSNKPKHHPDYSITFDYSTLLSSGKEKVQCSIISELSGTNLESLIKHPLIESFLYMKWCRIRGVFYFKVFQYFLYLMLHTVFIMMTYSRTTEPKDWSKDEFSLNMFRIFHVVFFVILVVPEVIVTMANLKKYLSHWETYTKIASLTSSIIAVCLVSGQVKDYVTCTTKVLECCKGNATECFETDFDDPDNGTISSICHLTCDDDDNKVGISAGRLFASLSMILGWVELMMLLGRFPLLGAFILMVTKVGKSIFKFLFAFAAVLIGFTLGFHILFQNMDQFRDIQLSTVKLLMILKGEITYKSYVNQPGVPFGLYSQIIMSVCLFLVPIIMSNLLTGLAVKGVPDLKRQGKIKRLIKQASYLMAFERLLAFTYKIKCFPRRLQSLLSSRLAIDTEITIYPNKEFRKHKYMRTLPQENITEAMNAGSCEEPEEDLTEDDEEDDVVEKLKSFQIRYTSDRRMQTTKIKDLSEMCTDIKKQLSDLSQQLEMQIQQGQNLYNQLSQKM